jgi:hypothetical protein
VGLLLRLDRVRCSAPELPVRVGRMPTTGVAGIGTLLTDSVPGGYRSQTRVTDTDARTEPSGTAWSLRGRRRRGVVATELAARGGDDVASCGAAPVGAAPRPARRR